jgi:hypothetical protein
MSDEEVLDWLQAAVTVLWGISALSAAMERWLLMGVSVLCVLALIMYQRYISAIIVVNRAKMKEEEKRQATLQAEMDRARQLEEMQKAVKKLRRQ